MKYYRYRTYAEKGPENKRLFGLFCGSETETENENLCICAAHMVLCAHDGRKSSIYST